MLQQRNCQLDIREKALTWSSNSNTRTSEAVKLSIFGEAQKCDRTRAEQPELALTSALSRSWSRDLQLSLPTRIVPDSFSGSSSKDKNIFPRN